MGGTFFTVKSNAKKLKSIAYKSAANIAENYNYGDSLPVSDKLDYESLDTSMISSSITGAKEGQYVSVYEDVFKNGDLNYEILEDNVVVIKNGDVPIGYTTTDGIKVVNKGSGYSSVVEDLQVGEYSATNPNAPSTPIDYSNISSKKNDFIGPQQMNLNDKTVYGPQPYDGKITNPVSEANELAKYSREHSIKYKNLEMFADSSLDEKKMLSKSGKTYDINGNLVSYDKVVKAKDGTIQYIKGNTVFKEIHSNGIIGYSDPNSSRGMINYKINSDGTYSEITSKGYTKYDKNGITVYYGKFDNDGNQLEKPTKSYSISFTGERTDYYEDGSISSIQSESGDHITRYDKSGQLTYERDYNIETIYSYDASGDMSQKIVDKNTGNETILNYKKGSTSAYEIIKGNNISISSDGSYTSDSDISYYDKDNNLIKIEMADGKVKEITEDGYVIREEKRNASEFKYGSLIQNVPESSAVYSALNKQNYNSFLNNSIEYYDNDGNLKYIKLTDTSENGNSGDNATIYPDGTVEFNRNDAYYKINPDGTYYQKELFTSSTDDQQSYVEEHYYDQNGNTIRAYHDGKLWLDRKANGDLYNYSLDTGEVWYIESADGKKTTQYLNGDEIVKIYDDNGGYTEYVNGNLSSQNN